MRKAWFATCTAAAMAAGCAGTNSTTTPGGYAVAPAAAPAMQATAPAALPAKPWYSRWIGGGQSKSPPSTGSGFAERGDAGFLTKSGSPDATVAMAELSQRGGNTIHARQLYQKALADNPHQIDALLGAARLEDREGNLEIAKVLYRQASIAHPNSATPHNDLGLCLARSGDLVGARSALEQAVRLDPGNALYRNNLAKVLVEQNEMEEATSHLMAVHPPAVAHFNMGVLLSQRGRNDEAINYTLTAAAIDPSFPPAQQLLTMLHVQGGNGDAATSPVQSASPSPGAQEHSILPAPQMVATVPWRPGAEPTMEQLESTTVEPEVAIPSTAVESSPMLLPPIN